MSRHVSVPTAGAVRAGDLFRPDGVTGWRTVQKVDTISNVGGDAGKSAVEVTLNGEGSVGSLVQFYSPGESVEARRSELSPFFGELTGSE